MPEVVQVTCADWSNRKWIGIDVYHLPAMKDRAAGLWHRDLTIALLFEEADAYFFVE